MNREVHLSSPFLIALTGIISIQIGADFGGYARAFSDPQRFGKVLSESIFSDEF